MADKQYDVLHSFTADIDGKPVRISGQKQAHLVAKIDPAKRDLLIANKRVREYDAPAADATEEKDGLASDDARKAQKAADKVDQARTKETAAARVKAPASAAK
jgi:hypothetical protein